MTAVFTQSLMNYDGGSISNNTPSFRNFVSAWSSMFSQSGWVNMEVSGTVNPTVVEAVAGGFEAGYQVWRFDDVLHYSGYPVYVRVGYGSYQLQKASLSFQVGFNQNNSGSVGTGVNGIGSTPSIRIFTENGSNGVLYNHRMCCISGSDLVAIMADNQTNAAPAFCVERTKNTYGQSTTDGIVIYTATPFGTTGEGWRQSSLMYNQNLSIVQPGVETLPTYLIGSNQAGAINNTITVGMFIPMLSSSFGYPSRMLGLINSTLLTNDALHTITLFNTSSQYFISSNTAPARNDGWRRGQGTTAETNNLRYIIRYE